MVANRGKGSNCRDAPSASAAVDRAAAKLGDVKSHLSELVSRLHGHHERVTVTVHGRPSAVLIAPEDLERLEETLEIMRDVVTMNRLAESDAELARGECVSTEEFAEVMRQRRAQ
jgi:antitoxin YefM